MPSAREDYLIRLITQAAAAIRRLREKLRSEGSSEEVVREASAAIDDLLGPQRTMLDLLDAKSAAALLAHDERVDAWIDFLRLQAEALRALGKESEAAKLETRADALDNVVAPFRR